MMEVVENMHMEDIEIPVKTKTVSFAEVEKLESDSDDVAFSENTELARDGRNNEKSVGRSHLPSSKWSQLARVFRLGVGVDAYQPNNSTSKEIPTILQPEIKSMDKRGSLGKMFRQGLNSFPRPMSAREPVKSNYGMTGSSSESTQGIEKRIKWNFFKHGKSLHHLSEDQKSGSSDVTKDNSKKRPLSKMLLRRSQVLKENRENNSLENLCGSSDQGQIPPPETRSQSMGKFFRQNKRPEFLKRTFSRERKHEME